MANNKRRRPSVAPASEITALGLHRQPDESTDLMADDSVQSFAPISARTSHTSSSFKERMRSHLRGRWWAVGIVAVLSLSAFASTWRYLEEDAAQQSAERARMGYLYDAQNESLVSKVNPFLVDPPPQPTPQLSKEYLYAGSRMLAVEDAAANPAIPADLAVWRPTSGIWYVMGAGNTVAASAGWGASGDVTVPGDYDGDGKTDFAVYRPGANSGDNSNWYVIKSSDPSGASYIIQTWGSYGDAAVPADYDGDHRTDIAVFRPTNHTWYILRSSDQTLQIIDYGNTSDAPAPADYDGDGRADVAVFRQSTSTFYLLRSSDNQFQAGQPSTTVNGAVAVPADYDGDGKADYAIRNGADWIIQSSATGGVQTVGWYASSDMAVQNDYDGDGRVDIAVWTPAGASAGAWYIRQSSHLGQSNELRTASWGAAGDTPVPALWRR